MALSGQKTVTTADTAVQLGTQNIGCSLLIKALDTNTGIVALGNDGANDVSLSTGLRLEPANVIVLEYVGNLASLWLDSAVDGEGVSWIVLSA